MYKHLLVGILLVGCGKKSGSGGEAPPPPAINGAPITFVAKSLKPGGDMGGTAELKAYNFSDKTFAQFMVVLRYHDKSGAVLKVKPGTPFEKETDFMSVSGKKYSCAPKSWCEMKLDHLSIPDNAATAEVIATNVGALKPDGTTFEDKSVFEAPSMDWPATPATK
jgi:hypothetical protein